VENPKKLAQRLVSPIEEHRLAFKVGKPPLQILLRKTLYSLFESDRGLLHLQFSDSKFGQLLFKILEIFEFKHWLSKIQVVRPRRAPRRRAATPPDVPPPEDARRPRPCASPGRRHARGASTAPRFVAVRAHDRWSVRGAARTLAGQWRRGMAESAPSPCRHCGTRALFKSVVFFSSSRHTRRSRPPHRATMTAAAELAFPRLSSAE
jgi:hypothetical protein